MIESISFIVALAGAAFLLLLSAFVNLSNLRNAGKTVSLKRGTVALNAITNTLLAGAVWVVWEHSTRSLYATALAVLVWVACVSCAVNGFRYRDRRQFISSRSRSIGFSAISVTCAVAVGVLVFA